MTRKAEITRRTNETAIQLALTVDGTGNSSIDTGVGFLNHMLDLFARHGLFDLALTVNGDLEVDYHHTVEDVGICLGQAFKDAMGDCAGINRYASVTVPMDESLASVSIDISNRPYLGFDVDLKNEKVGLFDTELVEEFFNGFVNNARINLHIRLEKGSNTHHKIEAIFKGFALALDQASLLNPRKKGIPSTKGIL
jgi:imidazoleglycerol-phosphate dehydratase